MLRSITRGYWAGREIALRLKAKLINMQGLETRYQERSTSCRISRSSMELVCTASWMLHLDNLRVLEVAECLILRMLPSCYTSNQKGRWGGGREKSP